MICLQFLTTKPLFVTLHRDTILRYQQCNESVIPSVQVSVLCGPTFAANGPYCEGGFGLLVFETVHKHPTVYKLAYH